MLQSRCYACKWPWLNGIMFCRLLTFEITDAIAVWVLIRPRINLIKLNSEIDQWSAHAMSINFNLTTVDCHQSFLSRAHVDTRLTLIIANNNRIFIARRIYRCVTQASEWNLIKRRFLFSAGREREQALYPTVIQWQKRVSWMLI